MPFQNLKNDVYKLPQSKDISVCLANDRNVFATTKPRGSTMKVIESYL